MACRGTRTAMSHSRPPISSRRGACEDAAWSYRNPAHVITKSALVRRGDDMGLLVGLASGPAPVSRSAPPLARTTRWAGRSSLSRPRAPTDSRRYGSSRARVCGTSSMVAGRSSGLNDTQIAEVLEQAEEAGAERAGDDAPACEGGVACVPGAARRGVPERAGEVRAQSRTCAAAEMEDGRSARDEGDGAAVGGQWRICSS